MGPAVLLEWVPVNEGGLQSGMQTPSYPSAPPSPRRPTTPGDEEKSPKSSEALPAGSNCQWMFGDVGKDAGFFGGIASLAHLNPMRWSDPMSFRQAISELEQIRNVA